MRLSLVTRARSAASDGRGAAELWRRRGARVTFPPCHKPDGIPRTLPHAYRFCGVADWSSPPPAPSSSDVATPRSKPLTPFPRLARKSTCAPGAPSANTPTVQAPTALAAHQPGIGDEEAAGAEAGPIFQLARVWRNAEGSDLHAAEFTMLEWYRPEPDMHSLIDEATAYLRAVLPPVVTCRGVTTDLSRVERLTVAEAFARYAGVDVLATAEDARRSPPRQARACARTRAGRTCSFACCSGASSRGLAARIPRSSPTGPPRRPRWRAATPPIHASPSDFDCSSAVSNWPTRSSN